MTGVAPRDGVPLGGPVPCPSPTAASPRSRPVRSGREQRRARRHGSPRPGRPSPGRDRPSAPVAGRGGRGPAGDQHDPPAALARAARTVDQDDGALCPERAASGRPEGAPQAPPVVSEPTTFQLPTAIATVAAVRPTARATPENAPNRARGRPTDAPRCARTGAPNPRASIAVASLVPRRIESTNRANACPRTATQRARTPRSPVPAARASSARQSSTNSPTSRSAGETADHESGRQAQDLRETVREVGRIDGDEQHARRGSRWPACAESSPGRAPATRRLTSTAHHCR